MELDIDLGARLVALLESQEARQRRKDDKRARIAGLIQQVPLAVPQMFATAQVATNGVIDVPDALKAKTGYYWSVRRLFLQGWTAGSVVVQKDSFEPLWPFATPGAAVFGKGQILINPDSRIVVAGTGITGNVQMFGAADCFPAYLLPYYLGVVELEE